MVCMTNIKVKLFTDGTTLSNGDVKELVVQVTCHDLAGKIIV